MLLSTTDDDVLAAAEALGEELRNAQQESIQLEFDSLLGQCNDAITDQIGVDYDDACDTDDCC
ncbi:halo-CC-star protein HcsS [Haloquadratum walsbyi]|uniref:halo-CC-star protein HcsS n=1 Tax=Haloquadratum walsbyi TaxID=293091 RepID=UPI000AC4F32B|nr:halo-CC-star protein HcsS [Haloquadratum walsbyi]